MLTRVANTPFYGRPRFATEKVSWMWSRTGGQREPHGAEYGPCLPGRHYNDKRLRQKHICYPAGTHPTLNHTESIYIYMSDPQERCKG